MPVCSEQLHGGVYTNSPASGIIIIIMTPADKVNKNAKSSFSCSRSQSPPPCPSLPFLVYASPYLILQAEACMPLAARWCHVTYYCLPIRIDFFSSAWRVAAPLAASYRMSLRLA